MIVILGGVLLYITDMKSDIRELQTRVTGLEKSVDEIKDSSKAVLAGQQHVEELLIKLTSHRS